MRHRQVIRAVMLASVAGAGTAAAQSPDAAQPAGTDTRQIIVTAPRLTTTARAEQKAAPNLINIQAAEDIVKYPDFNAAESLGRIPGVSIAIDTGEGRFVNIRGIDGNLNGTSFGGVTLLNTQPGGTYFGGGGRAVELDTIPIGAVDRLVVRKTGLPDQEAEGLGGSVELTPRTASHVKAPFVEGTVGGGYQPARKNWQVFRGELAAGTRFGGDAKPFAIVLYGSYHSDHRGFDDIEAGYFDSLAPGNANKIFDSAELRRYNYNRRRFGYGGELDYDPNPQSHYYVRATNAGYTESVNRQILAYTDLGDPVGPDPGNANGFVASAADAQSSLRDEEESHLNFITAIGGHNDLGNAIFDYQFAFTTSTYHRDRDFNSRFVRKGLGSFPVAYDNITNPDYPTLVATGFDPNDPTQYKLSRFSNATERAHDREYSGVIDATIPTTFFGADDAIKFGTKFRVRNKVDQPRNFSYVPPATPLTEVLGPGPFTDFYGNRFSVGYSPDALKLRKLFQDNPALFVQNTGSDAVRDAGGYFNDDENIYAGYFQYSGSYGPLGFLAGVRVENTDGTYRGITVTTDAIGNKVFTATARRNNYTNWFPTVQLRYEIAPDLIARGTYSTGIGRPGFLQLKAGASVDVGALAVSVGNPDLKPTTVNAFDAALEYYLPASGIVSFGLFDKEFNNYVLARVQRNVDYPGIGPGTTVNSYSNVGKSHARGFEAAYTQRFVRLPAPWDGFGVTGNVTYVDSRIEIRPGDFSLLPGTSKWTWNIGGFYEAHDIQLRLAAQRVSAAIFGAGSETGLDVFQDSRLTLDLTASYQVTHNLNVYFNARNLTNTPLRYYEGSANRPIQREFYDASYEGGVRFRF